MSDSARDWDKKCPYCNEEIKGLHDAGRTEVAPNTPTCVAFLEDDPEILASGYCGKCGDSIPECKCRKN